MSGKNTVKEMSMVRNLFVRRTETNMLFMRKEQNVHVISLNNAETVQQF